MIVCIAEKPSVGRDIAKILGATANHDGYLEGNGYQVTWALGHLCTLKEPGDYTDYWREWSLSSLPMVPQPFGIKLINDKGSIRQFHIVEKLIHKATSIINCGDAGQEGELIQRWIMQKAGATCPVQRLWISSLTEEAIREGFANLRPQSDYESLYMAGLCRAIGDWLLGMNATRLYTLRYRQAQRQVLSVGRVQTPTLAMIVARQKEIDNFKPEQYWVLATLYRNALFTCTKGKIESQADGQQQLDSIKEQPFTITAVDKKNGNEAPPRLFDLTGLQVDCNKKFGFSADDTLRHIQSLYEKKLTTYPRVDTTYLPDDVYPKCGKILEGLLPYRNLVEPLMGRPLPKSKKIFDSSKVTDHHAIIPTGVSPLGGDLTYDEKRVYDLVARHFIAVFYPDCKVATTTVLGEVTPATAASKPQPIQFKATGKQILSEGWRVVFQGHKSSEEEDKKDNENQVLPDFVKGESGPHTPQLSEKWTTPPKYYTEATLLRAMETAGKMVDNEELRDAMKENGIGRPSTRAAIIETLLRRSYIVKQRKNLVATPTGISLIDIIHEELLKSAELTGQWEKKLRDIEAKRYDAATFIDELKQMVAQIVWQVRSDTSDRRVAAAPAEAAPKAKAAARKSGEKAVTEPAKKRTPRKKKEADTAAKPTSQQATTLPPTATAPTTQPPAASQAAPAEGSVCPICGTGTVVRGNTMLGCSNWRNGCPGRWPLPDHSS